MLMTEPLPSSSRAISYPSKSLTIHHIDLSSRLSKTGNSHNKTSNWRDGRGSFN